MREIQTSAEKLQSFGNNMHTIVYLWQNNIIQIYSEITSGRVLDGNFYTQSN